MNNSEIFNKVKQLFIKILNRNLEINLESTPNDIDNWDSINHVQLINAIEKEFDIKFKLKELMQIKSINDICNAISEKIN